MEPSYQTLQALYTLVKDSPQPTLYQCFPRQLILFLHFDWATIYDHLKTLEKDGLVTLAQADTIQFAITERGISRIQTLTLTKTALSRTQ